MKSSSNQGLGVLSALFACGVLTASCGSNQTTSNLNWEQSRADTKRYAYLWESDLEDEFLFGGSVIGVDDFLSGALNFSLPPMTVKLELNEEGDKLRVMHVERERELMAFDVADDNGRYEIDFASAGNDLKLRGLIDAVGGQFTAARRDGYWVSQSAPEVGYIDQDNDTVVVNLKHTVQQVLIGQDPFTGEAYVREVLSEEPGDVTFRLWLQRKKVLPRVGSGAKTVSDGLDQNIGYFASSLAATASEDDAPIQRFALGDLQDAESSITFYLKDFPRAFESVAKEAVLSWNRAFDSNRTVKVAMAPDWMDVGDPRYHVIKWFDGTDKTLSWAGVAKMIVNPDTGVVMSGGVYIQGSSLIDSYQGITGFSENAARFPFESTGTIGNVDLSLDEGERPVIPYFTDISQDFAEYMQGYYKEVVAHEVGHVFGLRHNFQASTELDGNGSAASVMDYAPRSERNKYHGLGAYDLAAIRWAYYGERPRRTLPFCTDEHITEKWNCNQGDFGDPVAYHIRGLVDGIDLIRQAPLPLEDSGWTGPIKGIVKNAVKIYELRDQVPTAQRGQVDEKIPAALEYAANAEAHQGLSDEDRETVEENLRILKAQIAEAMQ